nr:MAG TPA: hypothetical protein [Caudoviricetes sp.]
MSYLLFPNLWYFCSNDGLLPSFKALRLTP